MPCFSNARIAYPPASLIFFALKDSAILELWAGQDSLHLPIRHYPIVALSGVAGPKLREGDRQVPEGVYRIDGLNPNSRFHLSMKLNYPNDFDIEQARREKRHEPGSNIFIHGRDSSVGCLAMGDAAIEELFVLVNQVGIQNIKVIISPTDPRVKPLKRIRCLPWTDELYTNIEREFLLCQR